VSVNTELPLAGVRILAFTQLGAGPYAMTLLGDLGAEVIKVEDPTTGGDEARSVPPFADAAARDGLYYQSLNRGARSLTLNLRAPRPATSCTAWSRASTPSTTTFAAIFRRNSASTIRRSARSTRGSSAARSRASGGPARASGSPDTTISSRRMPAS